MKNTWRENTIHTVRSIARDDMFAELRTILGGDDSAAIGELVVIWGDDMYHPGADMFREVFTPKEMSAMARFNEVFAAQDRPWEEPEQWETIRQAARELAQECSWNERAHFNGIEPGAAD